MNVLKAIDIPHNEIWYTTSNRKVVGDFDRSAFDAHLISNTFENGQGVLRFSNDITVIGESAFALNETLETIILPRSIVKIEAGAFSACIRMKEFNIPCNVSEIGPYAFGLCVNLERFSGKFATSDGLCLVVNGVLNQFALGSDIEEYAIPYDAIEIGWSAFSDSQLSKITLHENITTIGHSAFCGCEDLVEITIPSSVTTIEDVAFENCISLTHLYIPSSVKYIGANVFQGCENIVVECQDNTVINYALGDNEKSSQDVGVVFLGSPDIEEAKHIIIPDGVTQIDDSDFQCCRNVEIIYVPESVVEVQEEAFVSCENLKRFDSVYASKDGRCLIINNTLVGFAGCGVEEYVLPDSIVTIAPSVFCFENPIILKSITIPNGVQTIGHYAFCNCSSLISISIPESVKVIGNGAFNRCKSLNEIQLPSLAHVERNIFVGCDNLRIVKSNLMSEDGKALIVDDTLVGYIDAESQTEYEIPDGIKIVGVNAFCRNLNIETVVFPQSVNTIWLQAFAFCSHLKCLVFNSIVPPHFEYNSENLLKIYFHSSLKKLSILAPKDSLHDYFSIFKKIFGEEILVLDKDDAERMLYEIAKGSCYDTMISTTLLLKLGVNLHKEKNDDLAIPVLEKVICRGCNGDETPYKVLLSIYRKRKDIHNEVRVMSIVIDTLPEINALRTACQTKLEKISAKSSKRK